MPSNGRETDSQVVICQTEVAISPMCTTAFSSKKVVSTKDRLKIATSARMANAKGRVSLLRHRQDRIVVKTVMNV